ncbi:uncharacterized protein ASCRUDRAFT_130552 [Ascoidea rubescens DSM 1968]|uniref:Secreted peptide n=1 Tax=Ascoidea rubescens DSM 1968 TaxID=1344418 RepID=A0A1D2V8V0_9ASCO|nr:hypothetical protein ASCRUDRAFT_130552 [Ascoidea rubescens DSM 1968]ODV57937.1 hypothetical protein ASCRUDRAFT_130552 [Ascoidea rubescens DSM 1968]
MILCLFCRCFCCFFSPFFLIFAAVFAVSTATAASDICASSSTASAIFSASSSSSFLSFTVSPAEQCHCTPICGCFRNWDVSRPTLRTAAIVGKAFCLFALFSLFLS